MNVPAEPTGKAAAQPPIHHRADRGNNAGPPEGGQANSSARPEGRTEQGSVRHGRTDPKSIRPPERANTINNNRKQGKSGALWNQWFPRASGNFPRMT